MKKIFIILSLLAASSYAKDFYVEVNGLRFDLALNKHTRALAVSNYLDFKDMGSITRLEQSRPVREDNFIRDFGGISSDGVASQNLQIVERKLDSSSFFSCIEDGVALYSYELVQKNISSSQKVELALGVSKCESFLSEDFVFPDERNIFFYYGIVSKLSSAGKATVRDLFLKYIDTRLDVNEKFAIESLLTMISYDVQFKEVSTIDLAAYKERLKSDIILSTAKLKGDIQDKSDFVNVDIDSSALLNLLK